MASTMPLHRLPASVSSIDTSLTTTGAPARSAAFANSSSIHASVPDACAATGRSPLRLLPRLPHLACATQWLHGASAIYCSPAVNRLDTMGSGHGGRTTVRSPASTSAYILPHPSRSGLPNRCLFLCLKNWNQPFLVSCQKKKPLMLQPSGAMDAYAFAYLPLLLEGVRDGRRIGQRWQQHHGSCVHPV
ncbi:hypothetical protein ACQJBY_004846 [Aegilops geniculata]